MTGMLVSNFTTSTATKWQYTNYSLVMTINVIVFIVLLSLILAPKAQFVFVTGKRFLLKRKERQKKNVQIAQ